MFAYVIGYGKLACMGEICTDRLRLLPLDESHVPAVHEMSIDPEVRRYLWEGQIISVDRVREMVVDSEACFAAHGTGFYAMFICSKTDPDDGKFVGFCGHRVFENGRDMELLFSMQPSFWGKGFGGEAARAVLHHGFDECNISQVIAATDTPNQRSVRVLQKLGMSFRERREWHGLDTVFYQLDAQEFGAN